MRIIVAFSGGKDSLAALIWTLKEFDSKRDQIEVVFNDTKWEHPLTYAHIAEVEKKLDISVNFISSKYSFEGLVEKKNRFPSARARFCTEKLKIEPTIDHILDGEDHVLLIQGIRAAESERRARMSKECRVFKYYFQAYRTTSQGKNLYHTYRKKDVFGFCEKYDDSILRPVFEFSDKQVFNYIKDAGLDPNPLYKMGMGRVGCMPCCLVNHREMKHIIKRFPEVIDKIRTIEQRVESTFFPVGYIPDWACSRHAINKHGKKSYFPTIDDVVKYLSSKDTQLAFFEKPTEKKCMSIYNLCE